MRQTHTHAYTISSNAARSLLLILYSGFQILLKLLYFRVQSADLISQCSCLFINDKGSRGSHTDWSLNGRAGINFHIILLQHNT